MAAKLKARVFPQFTALLEALQDYVGKRANSHMNMGQSSWLDICNSQDTRLELLEKLDRVALNEEFKQISEKGDEYFALLPAVIELQHDFIAAIARDVFAIRSPRLSRLYRQVTLDAGYASDKGIIRATILTFIETLVNYYNVLENVDIVDDPGNTEYAGGHFV